MSKKKFTVFGNCQSSPIAHLLLKSPSFAKKYEYVPTQHVQEIEAKGLEAWKRIIGECDLIVYQKVSETYRIPQLSASNLVRLAKPNSIKLSFPSLYFNAYFPFLGRKLSSQSLSLLNLIEDYFWLGLYVGGLNPEQAREVVLDRNLFSLDEAKAFYTQSISEIKKREEGIDVTVSSIYAERYQSSRVGYQFNHPTLSFLSQVANKILNTLGEENLIFTSAVKRLDNISVGIYPSLYQNLGLSFVEDAELYMTKDGPHSLLFVLGEMWKFYQNNYEKETIVSILRDRKPWIISKLDEMCILKLKTDK
jgi:Polysaccharide biosynthesis enzyme WcbI